MEINNHEKLDDVDIVKGETVVSVLGEPNDEELELRCANGNIYNVSVSYEYGCDSHAFISDISMQPVIGHKIVDAHHEDMDSYGTTLVFVTDQGKRGTIAITHDHNGYYGFSYHVEKLNREHKF